MKKIELLMIGLLTFSQADFSRTEHSTVIDSQTKLEWQDNVTNSKKWHDTLTYCQELNLNGRGWRLPNINELKSLIVDTQFAPSIDSKFEYTQNNSYWSSTRKKISPSTSWSEIWGVNFNSGNTTYLTLNRSYTSNSGSIRCVRDVE